MNLIYKIVAVILFYCIYVSLVFVTGNHDIDNVDLPESQLPYYFNSFPGVIQQCLSNSSCKYRTILSSDSYEAEKCWGYEAHCQPENAFSTPTCVKDKPIWIKSQEEYVKTFYDQADFGNLPHNLFITSKCEGKLFKYRFFTGYIRNQINELMVLCTPLFPNDSMLECSKNLRFCHGRNIMINFTEIGREKQQWRYKVDILRQGQIGKNIRRLELGINSYLSFA